MRHTRVVLLLGVLHFSSPVAGQAQFGEFLNKKSEEIAVRGGDSIGATGRTTGDAGTDLPGVFFDPGSIQIRSEAAAGLQEIAALLARQADLQLIIEGHTDNAGSASANQRLSERRAVAVRDLLVAQGIAPARLQARGLGASHPLASNALPEGRRANRRVELLLRGR